MAAKKKPAPSKTCICGGECKTNHPRLSGYLLIAFGLLALPINFGLLSGLEWAKAWPLILVLIGAVMIIKVTVCQMKSR